MTRLRCNVCFVKLTSSSRCPRLLKDVIFYETYVAAQPGHMYSLRHIRQSGLSFRLVERTPLRKWRNHKCFSLRVCSPLLMAIWPLLFCHFILLLNGLHYGSFGFFIPCSISAMEVLSQYPHLLFMAKCAGTLLLSA